jgi:hypothetical protein
VLGNELASTLSSEGAFCGHSSQIVGVTYFPSKNEIQPMKLLECKHVMFSLQLDIHGIHLDYPYSFINIAKYEIPILHVFMFGCSVALEVAMHGTSWPDLRLVNYVVIPSKS